MGRIYKDDLPDGVSEMFFARGLDSFWLICPSGADFLF
jgi:hypothetical protein